MHRLLPRHSTFLDGRGLWGLELLLNVDSGLRATGSVYGLLLLACRLRCLIPGELFSRSLRVDLTLGYLGRLGQVLLPHWICLAAGGARSTFLSPFPFTFLIQSDTLLRGDAGCCVGLGLFLRSYQPGLLDFFKSRGKS